MPDEKDLSPEGVEKARREAARKALEQRSSETRAAKRLQLDERRKALKAETPEHRIRLDPAINEKYIKDFKAGQMHAARGSTAIPGGMQGVVDRVTRSKVPKSGRITELSSPAYIEGFLAQAKTMPEFEGIDLSPPKGMPAQSLASPQQIQDLLDARFGMSPKEGSFGHLRPVQRLPLPQTYPIDPETGRRVIFEPPPDFGGPTKLREATEDLERSQRPKGPRPQVDPTQRQVSIYDRMPATQQLDRTIQEAWEVDPLKKGAELSSKQRVAESLGDMSKEVSDAVQAGHMSKETATDHIAKRVLQVQDLFPDFRVTDIRYSPGRFTAEPIGSADEAWALFLKGAKKAGRMGFKTGLGAAAWGADLLMPSELGASTVGEEFRSAEEVLEAEAAAEESAAFLAEQPGYEPEGTPPAWAEPGWYEEQRFGERDLSPEGVEDARRAAAKRALEKE